MKKMQKMELCVPSSFRCEIYDPANHHGEPSAESNQEDLARRAILQTPVKQGEVVFANEPFAHVLGGEERATRCSYCFIEHASPAASTAAKKCATRPKEERASNTPLMSCSKCNIARYCGAACQRADWTAGHKWECKHIGSLIADGCSSGPLDEILLLIRVHNLLKLKATSTSSSTKAGVAAKCETSGVNVSCCAAHVSDLCVGGDFDDVSISTLAEAIRRLSSSGKTPVDPKSLLAPLSRLYASFRANNFGIVSHMMRPLGAMVAPHAALLNHSCAPNCLLDYQFRSEGKPPLLRAVALRDLSPGEELTHCYLDATQLTQQVRVCVSVCLSVCVSVSLCLCVSVSGVIACTSCIPDPLP